MSEAQYVGRLRRDRLWRETHRAVAQALASEGSRFASWLINSSRTTLLWGPPYAQLEAAPGPPVDGGLELVLCLERDWLATVHGEGIAIVDGYFVLRAEPVSAANFPDGADAAWSARLLDLHWLAGLKGVEAVKHTSFLARYGGLVRSGSSPAGALARCLAQCRADLGAEGVDLELPRGSWPNPRGA